MQSRPKTKPRGSKYRCLVASRGVYRKKRGELGLGFRVQVPNNLVLGFSVIGSLVQVLGKYMVMRYLDPIGQGSYSNFQYGSIWRGRYWGMLITGGGVGP